MPHGNSMSSGRQAEIRSRKMALKDVDAKVGAGIVRGVRSPIGLILIFASTQRCWKGALPVMITRCMNEATRFIELSKAGTIERTEAIVGGAGGS